MKGPFISRSILRQLLVPLMVAFAVLMITFYGWQLAKENVQRHARLKFENQVKELVDNIENRLQLYIDALYGAQALFAASKSVERDEWRAYMTVHRIWERYPGVLAFRYLEKVAAKDKELFSEAVRKDISLTPAGYPDFRIYPETTGEDLMVTKYVEPMLGNEAMLGFDASADPVRYAALEKARDTNEPQVTGKIYPTTHLDKPAFAIYLPVYKNSLPHETVDERRQALVGAVGVVFTAERFFSEVFAKGKMPAGVECEAFEKGSIKPEGLLYDSDETATDSFAKSLPIDRQPLMLEFSNRLWSLRFFGEPGFGLSAVEKRFPLLVLFGGVSAGFLIFAILFLLSTSRIRAVTEAERMTEELRKNSELLSNILSTIPHCVFWKDKNSVYLGCNENFAKVAGLTHPSQVTGKTDYDLAWKKEEADFFRKIDREVMEKGESQFNVEEPQLQASGRQAVLLTSKVPLRDSDGRVIGILGVFTDITDRKKIESQIFQAQKMETVGTLAGGIAHDLNNQLTPIAGYVDFLLQQVPKDNPIREILVEVQKASQRCVETVQRIRNFSRSSGQQKTVIRAAGVFQELKRFLPKLLPSTILTHIVCAEDLWPVLGNETEIQTVLLNLATNARDAMPEGGSLEIRAQNVDLRGTTLKPGFPPGHYVLISVKDSGAGIEPGVLPRIFEPFFTTKAKSQGTGLGLAMVFSIVTSHRGWIDVSSQPGRGTTFHIYLPAASDMPADDKKEESAPALPRGRETILFADDEEALRNMGKAFLERLGYKVIFASDGEEAVRVYHERHPEIAGIVLDMTMPKMTGRQVLKKLLEINPRARIVLASGYTSEGSSEELIREGAAAFLSKPYSIMPLAQTLRKALDRTS